MNRGIVYQTIMIYLKNTPNFYGISVYCSSVFFSYKFTEIFLKYQRAFVHNTRASSFILHLPQPCQLLLFTGNVRNYIGESIVTYAFKNFLSNLILQNIYQNNESQLSVLAAENQRKCDTTLQWRHNYHHVVSNHLQSYACSTVGLSIKKVKARVTGPLLWGIHRWPVDFPFNKGPDTRKTFPLHDVIMNVSR